MAADEIRYTIEEVSDLTGLKAHVLRFWEGEFPRLRPERTRANQRLYRQKDLDLLLHIKKLVHERGFTLAGARRQLEDDLKEARQGGQLSLELDLGTAEATGAVVKARRQVRSLLDWLDRTDALAEAEGAADGAEAPPAPPSGEPAGDA